VRPLALLLSVFALSLLDGACGSGESKQVREQKLLASEETAARNECARRHLACRVAHGRLTLPWGNEANLYFLCRHGAECSASVKEVEAQMNKAHYWTPPVNERKVYLEANLKLLDENTLHKSCPQLAPCEAQVYKKYREEGITPPGPIETQ
jgi:hypothetical protein